MKYTSKKSQKGRPKKARFLVIFPVTILVAIVLFIFFIALGRQMEINKQASDALPKIIAARASVIGDSDRREKEVEALIAASGFSNGLLASSKLDICTSQETSTSNDTIGDALASRTYYQECYLRYVSAYDTHLNKDGVISALQSHQEILTALGLDAKPADDYYSPCDIFSNNSSTISLNDETLETALAVGYSCKPVDPYSQDVYQSDYSLSKQNISIKTYKSFNARDFLSQPPRLWVTTEVHYYKEYIGCSALGLLCGNPRPLPVQAP